MSSRQNGVIKARRRKEEAEQIETQQHSASVPHTCVRAGFQIAEQEKQCRVETGRLGMGGALMLLSTLHLPQAERDLAAFSS